MAKDPRQEESKLESKGDLWQAENIVSADPSLLGAAPKVEREEIAGFTPSEAVLGGGPATDNPESASRKISDKTVKGIRYTIPVLDGDTVASWQQLSEKESDLIRQSYKEWLYRNTTAPRYTPKIENGLVKLHKLTPSEASQWLTSFKASLDETSGRQIWIDENLSSVRVIPILKDGQVTFKEIPEEAARSLRSKRQQHLGEKDLLL